LSRDATLGSASPQKDAQPKANSSKLASGDNTLELNSNGKKKDLGQMQKDEGNFFLTGVNLTTQNQDI
jgi:hypothetical protein